MGQSYFIKLTEEKVIDPKEVFSIPPRAGYSRNRGPVRPTHLGVKNGQMAFFYSPDEEGEEYHSNNHWHFFPIPDGISEGQFPDAKIGKGRGNNHYGKPKWDS